MRISLTGSATLFVPDDDEGPLGGRSQENGNPSVTQLPDDFGTRAYFDRVGREVLITLGRGLAAFVKAIEEAAAASPAPSVYDLDSESLGRDGWPVPMWGPASLATRLKGRSTAELDAMFCEAYAADDSRRYRDMIADLLEASALKTWKELIRECDFAFQHARYRIVVPSLLLIIEGCLCEIGGVRQDRNAKPLRIVTDDLEPGIVSPVLFSVRGFLSEVYARHDFAEARRPIINRHWIFHGRDHVEWGQSDCLRLFQALHTLCCLTDEAFARKVSMQPVARTPTV